MAAVLIIAAADTRAQNPYSVSAVANFTVNSKIIFTMTGSLLFPNSDPDLVNPITSTAPFTLKTRAAGTVQVLIRAAGDLQSDASASDKIPLGSLTFASSVTGWTSQRPMGTADQTLMQWDYSGDYAGTVTFALANSWSYPIGNYSTTLTLTVIAP